MLLNMAASAIAMNMKIFMGCACNSGIHQMTNARKQFPRQLAS